MRLCQKDRFPERHAPGEAPTPSVSGLLGLWKDKKRCDARREGQDSRNQNEVKDRRRERETGAEKGTAGGPGVTQWYLSHRRWAQI